MTNVAILGATGYTAYELTRILLRHPGATIVAATSRTEAGRALSEIHPSLVGRIDLKVESLSPEQVAKRADCVFSCLPHCASAEQVPAYLDAGCKVIDFSADYRLGDARTFSDWYDADHPDPARLGHVPYGLPELFRKEIVDTSLVANPGCYPTTAILALAPLLRAELIRPTGVIIDSKSGVSGAGRKPKLLTHYPECNESIAAYGVGTHRHTPEIERILGLASEEGDELADVEVIFTPHLTPMDRGILTTAYSVPADDADQAELTAVLRDFYADEPFVHVVDHLPATKHVAGTNNCHIAVRLVRGRVLTVSAIDNLIKGASGAAVQNFNLMFGYPETTALVD